MMDLRFSPYNTVISFWDSKIYKEIAVGARVIISLFFFFGNTTAATPFVVYSHAIDDDKDFVVAQQDGN